MTPGDIEFTSIRTDLQIYLEKKKKTHYLYGRRYFKIKCILKNKMQFEQTFTIKILCIIKLLEQSRKYDFFQCHKP